MRHSLIKKNKLHRIFFRKPLRCPTSHCDQLLNKIGNITTTCYTHSRTDNQVHEALRAREEAAEWNLHRPRSHPTWRHHARSPSTCYWPHSVEQSTNWRSNLESPRIRSKFQWSNLECPMCALNPLPESRWAQVNPCTGPIPCRPGQRTTGIPFRRYTAPR